MSVKMDFNGYLHKKSVDLLPFLTSKTSANTIKGSISKLMNAKTIVIVQSPGMTDRIMCVLR